MSKTFIRSVALAILLVACGTPARANVVDGWPIGEAASCADEDCEGVLRVAVQTLDVREPAHAAILAMTVHDLGVLLDEQGNQLLNVYSGGPPTVVRFELADGSVRAVGVKWVVGDELIGMDWGPALDFEPPAGR